jgi:putative phosphoribosyl transferase
MFVSGPVYRDREEAGRRLADRLAKLAGTPVTVLALPRGGVPVAAIIARRLAAPMDVFIVRKVGAPGNPEYGLGAVAEGGVVLVDYDRAAAMGLRAADLEGEIREAREEVERRVHRYRNDRPSAPVEGRTVVLVDDGLATGSTARAAVRALRTRKPRQIVLAVGVSAPDAYQLLSREVDELVCPFVPGSFMAVGEWYREFTQLTDAEVLRLLERGRVGADKLPVGA